MNIKNILLLEVLPICSFFLFCSVQMLFSFTKCGVRVAGELTLLVLKNARVAVTLTLLFVRSKNHVS